MKCIARVESSDRTIKETEHEGADLKECMASFLSENIYMTFEQKDIITFRITEE